MIMLMELVPTSYVHWFGSIAAYIVIGMVWYSQNLFGKRWMKLAKIKTKDLEMDVQKIMGMSVIAAIMTSVLMILFKHMSANTISDGMCISAYVWFGFVVPVRYSDVLWGNKSIELFFIEVGGALASMLAMGAIIAYGMTQII